MDKPPIIWVVEDDESIQRLIADALTFNHYEPVVFGSAEKAYAALSTQTLPVLIILDVLLPGMSGMDLVRLVKQHKTWEKIPIVIVSVLSQEEGKKSGVAEQTAFWINKPFDAENLIEAIHRVLNSVGQERKAS